ncbi:MAG: hypothetical protein Q9219_007397 [cf. Caloplaca sp. 3 TL-2023]
MQHDDSTNTVDAHLLRSPIPTPHWGLPQSSSAFTVNVITTINAPPSVVLNNLLDTSTYPLWNNFVPRVVVLQQDPSINPSPHTAQYLHQGTLFTEHVDMSGNGKPSGLVRMRLLMTHLEQTDNGGHMAYQVVWLGKGYPDWALRSERVHVVIGNEEGGCKYHVWETFSGPLAVLVRVFVGRRLVERFLQWNAELKGFSEGRGRRGGEGGG